MIDAAKNRDAPAEAERAWPEGVTVLTGPAGAGKTAAVVALYRQHLDELGCPHCLLIVPNAPAAAQMRQRLLELSESGVLIAPAVTTFAGLAVGILSAAGRPAGMLSSVQRRLLLGGIVARLRADGALKALGPLVDTPGLVSALDASIAELKRAAVEPEALARAIDPKSDKDADLLAVYRLYQEHLLAAGRFDVEGLMWLARDVLAGDADAPLGYEDVAAAAVDGFTDFTPTQLEILAHLTRRAGRMLISLPFADQPARRWLWSWTQRTLDRIRRAIPHAGVLAMPEDGDPLARLFDLTGLEPDKETRGGQRRADLEMTVLAAADLEAEVAAVARAVKADLVGGLAGRKTPGTGERGAAPPGSIALIARNLTGYDEPIQRIFAAHDIPIASPPVRLDACSVVRYVLRLLSLPPRYEFHDVLAAIRNSYFRPAALAEGFDDRTVATAEMAIRTANVLGGRESYGQAFSRLAARARMGPDRLGEDETIALGPLAADADAIERAAEMLEALMSRLDRLAAAGDVESYVRGVRELVAELEVASAAAEHEEDSLVAADLRALRALDELLGDLARAELPAAGAGGEEFAELVVRSAEVAACPPARGESLATVLDVLDARAMRFERVYLLGVNEKAFPQLTQDRCFIDESDRAAWARRGVVLDRRSDLIAREMLLFYLAATRAEKALTVSYLAAGGSGESHSRSTFVSDLLAAADRQGITCRQQHIGPGRFVPAAEELSCRDDAFNAAVYAAFGDERERPDQAGALLGWGAEHRPELLRRAAFGIFAADRRWREGALDAYDGRVDDARLLKTLDERIPAKTVFSATELNSYAQCPWQFFARYLLRLEPLAEPEARMTPAARGSFCHAVLWRVFTELRERAGGAFSLADVKQDELRSVLEKAVEAEKARLADHAVYSALWDVQTNFWRRMLDAYLAGQRQAPCGDSSVYFELGFGVSPRGGERLDPLSTPEPVRIDAGGVTIRLEGKIDRVDRVGGAEGALLAVDYKTGRVPSYKEMTGAHDLQLALYAKALEAIFDSTCAGGAYHDLRKSAHRYFAGFKLYRGERRAEPDYEDKLKFAMRAAGLYVQGMRRGRFDALPEHTCPSYCPYRQICHYSEHRARRKTAGGGLSELAREGGDG